MQAAHQMSKLYSMMMEKDATMIEINPMVEALDPSGQKKGTASQICKQGDCCGTNVNCYTASKLRHMRGSAVGLGLLFFP